MTRSVSVTVEDVKTDYVKPSIDHARQVRGLRLTLHTERREYAKLRNENERLGDEIAGLKLLLHKQVLTSKPVQPLEEELLLDHARQRRGRLLFFE